MTHDELTPDEFARLLALPEDHPDRRRVSGTPDFETRLRLHQQFVSGDPIALPDETRAAAERELGERLARSLATADPPRAGGAGAPEKRDESDLGATRRTVTRGRFPVRHRVALWALAATLIVVATATWVVTRQPVSRAVRGAPVSGGIVMAEPRPSAGALDLEWSPAPGADRYVLVFYGADLNEITRVEGSAAPRITLRADALPAGLAHGQELLAGVIAMRNGDPIAESKPRSLRIP
ncbi:MAG: hypothetical protein ACHQ52_06420 [Candidatus Eisenbacteria bacterium]